MDPLVDVLTLLDARSRFSSRFAAGCEPWRVDFDRPDGLKFNAVLTGNCLLAVDGLEPMAIGAGDCYLLTRPQPFVLASALSAPPVAAAEVFARPADGAALVGCAPGEDPAFTALGGSFTFSGPAARLLDALPPVLLVPSGAAASDGLGETLASIDRELRQGLPGGSLIAQHLAIAMLVRMVRRHLAHDSALPQGWLRGLADPAVSAALGAIHDAPEYGWTVADLAHAGRVSRSTLAQRFRDTVGTGPIEYLIEWRMELASRQLALSTDSIARVGRRLGYASESAFSAAFKRIHGEAPSHHRSRRQAARADRVGST